MKEQPTPVIIPEIMPKERKGGRKKGQLTTKVRTAIKLTADHGVPVKEAMILAGYGPRLPNSTVKGIRDKAAKYALTSPRMVRKAHRAIEDTLDMKPITYAASKPVAGIGVVDYTETIMPTVTNRLAAASMVMDRDQPTINRNVNLNINADLHPVDLSKYCNRK